MNNKIFLSVIFLFLSLLSSAREGMWIPSLIEKNIAEMQQMGFNLTAEDIYNTDSTGMKDAIVHFGSGCTGELISPDGLLVTNYHCGFPEIQSHSSLEHDYITDGFWAMSREEELLNQGLTVTFLISMKEVTDKVFACTDTLSKAIEIDDQIQRNIATIIDEEEESGGYNAQVKPFYGGNQYYLFLTETFTDVRLVGAPPSLIGKFGGDTDNWIWPRHTGDFSLFRIYSNKENKPADYSPDNVPYRSKSFFPINISGIKEGDFTMVFGYPGNTQQYLPSQAVKMILENSDPDRVAIRDLKLNILSDFMLNDPSTRIKYASKYANISNSWKKWQGEMLGLKRQGVVETKIREEKEFTRWINEDDKRKSEYVNILPDLEKFYSQLIPYRKAYDYYNECFYRGPDAYKNYLTISSLSALNKPFDIKELSADVGKQFNDYSFDVDSEMFLRLIGKYYSDLPAEFLPAELKTIFSKKDFQNILKKIYSKSILVDKTTMLKIVSDTSAVHEKAVLNDQLYQLFHVITSYYNSSVRSSYFNFENQINANQKKYMKAQLEMKNGQMLYPDANSTLRVSFGKVEGFKPRDGVTYNFYTTLKGIIQKEDPEVDDYNVPEKLKELYRTKDFGMYSMSDSTLPVCFTASNHTTGGNSGSPVIDANGYLIGVNFDRNWEGTMSDIEFDPDKCRNISLDVRYMLFIIDKFAGAGYLLNEMKIVR